MNCRSFGETNCTSDKFYKEHIALRLYLQSEATFNDKAWFMRSDEEEEAPPGSREYNQDPQTSSPKDWEVAMIGAYGWFAEYVQEQLIIVEGKKLDQG